MVLKLPGFKPKIPERIALENPNKCKINSMALYGKKATNTEVSTTSDSLSNTGVRFGPNSIVVVPNLSNNENYSFAVAAYDIEENLSLSIGETLKNITTSQPLPINLLYCYLAKIAFQLGDLDTSLEAAKKGCSYLIENTDIRERNLDFEHNPITFKRFKVEIA